MINSTVIPTDKAVGKLTVDCPTLLASDFAGNTNRYVLYTFLSMFTHQGLFKSLACPDRDACNRPHCLYSHASNISPTKLPQFIVKAPPPIIQTAIPIKRPVVQTTSLPTSEPPRKFQKVGTSQRPLAVPSASHSEVRSIYIFLLPCIN